MAKNVCPNIVEYNQRYLIFTSKLQIVCDLGKSAKTDAPRRPLTPRWRPLHAPFTPHWGHRSGHLCPVIYSLIHVKLPMAKKPLKMDTIGHISQFAILCQRAYYLHNKFCILIFFMKFTESL